MAVQRIPTLDSPLWASQAAPWRARLSLAIVILMVHWLLFGNIPTLFSTSSQVRSGSDITRTSLSITLEIAPPPSPVPTRRNAIQPSTSKPVMTQGEEIPEARQESGSSEDVATATPIDSPTLLAIAGPTLLKYDLKGVANGQPTTGSGELHWQHNEKQYEARLEIADSLLGLRTQTSRGQMTANGLEPVRFEENARNQFVTFFDWGTGKISFSAGETDAVLTPGVQDQLSVFIQLASIFSYGSDHLAVGDTIALQTADARSSSRWVFQVGETEPLALLGGTLTATHLKCEPTAAHETQIDVWLAPETGYLPIRIRLSRSNGDIEDLTWIQ